jgi:hypothetical protein
MIITTMMLIPKLYYIFLISLTIIPSMFFSHFPPSALAFHTASTANVTMHTGESTSDANDESLPLETVTEIYNHTNKALQALSEGNTSEVENQLNSTKEKLSLIMSNNKSAQEGQESNTTQTVASLGANSNTDLSGDTAINSAEDSAAVESATSPPDETATIEADAQNDNQGISERGMREGSEESPQGVP